MLVLKAKNGNLFYLQGSQRFMVGRKGCDLLIKDDQSISRMHAELFFRDRKLILVDSKSTYGTFVNNERLELNKEMPLKIGVEIRFGQFQSIYRLEKISIITTTSSIKGPQKDNLLRNMKILEGRLDSNWTENCTHLTAEAIILTVKVLCAIIKGTPIVTLKYWDDYTANVKENLPPPDVGNYKPPCSEITLDEDIQLDFKPERSTIFEKKTFVFHTQSDKARMADLIQLAGGEAISWDTNPFTIQNIENSKRDYIIIELGTGASQNIEPALSTIIKYYKQHGKRTIPIQEIALAIISCSCEKNCNPSFDRRGMLFGCKSQRFNTRNTQKVLVPATQTQYPATQHIIKPEEIITQTCNLLTETDIKLENVKASSISERVPTPTLKRENEDRLEILSDASNCKRSKMETTVSNITNLNSCEIVKNEVEPERSTDDTFVLKQGLNANQNHLRPAGKDTFGFKKTTNTNNNLNEQEVRNKFIFKRKVRENDEVDNAFKRSNKEISEVSLAETSKIVNTFCLREPTDTSKLNDENVDESNFVEDKVSYKLRLGISAIRPVDDNLEKSISWLSKTKTKDCKSSTTLQTTTTSEDDDELTKFIQSFRNTIVIEPIHINEFNNSKISESSSSTSSNMKNFKVFKKVQPLAIQTTIIPESSYKSVICCNYKR